MSNKTLALPSPLIECWSCHKFVSESGIRRADGYCPACDQPIDLEDEEVSDEQ